MTPVAPAPAMVSAPERAPSNGASGAPVSLPGGVEKPASI
jgi:hypothetical protein